MGFDRGLPFIPRVKIKISLPSKYSSPVFVNIGRDEENLDCKSLRNLKGFHYNFTFSSFQDIIIAYCP